MHTFPTTESRTEALGEVLDFLQLLWAVEHRLKSASKRMEQRLRITGPQRLVLRIVQRFPGISATELASVVQLHPSTITGIIERLRVRRLLSCERDYSDRRRMRLTLRSAAHAHMERPAGATVESAVADALKRVPRRKVQCAKDALLQVVASLERQPEYDGRPERGFRTAPDVKLFGHRQHKRRP